MTSFSVAVAVEKQRGFFVDNLMLGVQLADVLARCSSHPQGKNLVEMLASCTPSINLSTKNLFCFSKVKNNHDTDS